MHWRTRCEFAINPKALQELAFPPRRVSAVSGPSLVEETCASTKFYIPHIGAN
jgi:hypothetical protein